MTVTILVGLAASSLTACVAFDHVAEHGRLRALPAHAAQDLQAQYRTVSRFLRWQSLIALGLVLAEIASIATVVAMASDGSRWSAWPLWCLHLTCLIYVLFAAIAVMECREINGRIDKRES